MITKIPASVKDRNSEIPTPIKHLDTTRRQAGLLYQIGLQNRNSIKTISVYNLFYFSNIDARQVIRHAHLCLTIAHDTLVLNLINFYLDGLAFA